MTSTSDEVGHTATPWFWSGDTLMADRSAEHHSLHVMFITKLGELSISKSDRAFILRAVNSHDSLVKALEEAADKLRTVSDLGRGDDATVDEALEVIDAALSQAKGGK